MEEEGLLLEAHKSHIWKMRVAELAQGKIWSYCVLPFIEQITAKPFVYSAKIFYSEDVRTFVSRCFLITTSTRQKISQEQTTEKLLLGSRP
jgi:hypothetical protein